MLSADRVARIALFILCTVAWASVFVASAGTVLAQSDPFGAVDMVYLDSVSARPGEQVAIGVYVRNDEPLGSLSIPLAYDTTALQLVDVRFDNSRVAYIAMKLVDPADIITAEGQFTVAIIRLLEDPIPPGDGLVFTAVFAVDSQAVVGQTLAIDSTFMPPGGELLLVEAASATAIKPGFTPGHITLVGENRAPRFLPLADQTLFEGDTLRLAIEVDDPDRDRVVLTAVDKPLGATFTDNGDGTGLLVWTPPYVGPTSADGSPFGVSFRATDGWTTVEAATTIQVINRNRAPEITAPDTVTVAAGDEVRFEVRAFDPDFETVTWQVQTTLDGYTFSDGNPALFTWSSQVTDSGLAAVELVATDPLGLSATHTVVVRVTAATLYTVAIDSASAFPDEEVTVTVNLDNRLPINGYTLVVRYDPTALSLVAVSDSGTRADAFEVFSYTPGYQGVTGDVRLVGRLSADGTASLPAGQGPVARLTFRTTGDLSFAGFSIPVGFRPGGGLNDDNTLLDSAGSVIPDVEIVFRDGFVRIHDLGDVIIGDINLNGLAAEIADVIYFTNHFIDPRAYPFSALQYANSDVNGDNLAATVADLVTLIRMVVEGTPPSRVTPPWEDEVRVVTEPGTGRVEVQYQSEVPVAAARLEMTVDRPVTPEDVRLLRDGMSMDVGVEDQRVRVVVYSWDGALLEPGTQPLIAVDHADSLTLEVVELADATGRLLSVASFAPASLPEDFALLQNYPNPFNPETNIEFVLPYTSAVRLHVYNVLGRLVTTLVDGVLPAGQHRVRWDGRDAAGQAVSSGVYFYRLQAGDRQLTRKMVLMK